MTISLKVNGAWVTGDRVYVKVAGVWRECTEAYVKSGGIWRQTHEYDVIPTSPPLISLELVRTRYRKADGSLGYGRNIQVGVRLPGVHDPDLKRIRVLTTYAGKSPTTYLGGTYHSGAADEFPNEPWSDWQYNGFSGSNPDKSSAEYKYKRWPRNVGERYTVEAGRHYFAAWAEDLNGNWSNGVFTSIDVPRVGVGDPNVVIKEGRFQADTSGSWNYISGAFSAGELRQGTGPRTRGMWFYGNQIANAIGNTPTIKSAQIYVPRSDDTGTASANIYIFRHNYGTPGSITGVPVHTELVKLGEVAKGEAKWLPIPQSYYADLKTQKGFGLAEKANDTATAQAGDFSVIKGTDQVLRSGEVHVVWEEEG